MLAAVNFKISVRIENNVAYEQPECVNEKQLLYLLRAFSNMFELTQLEKRPRENAMQLLHKTISHSNRSDLLEENRRGQSGSN